MTWSAAVTGRFRLTGHYNRAARGRVRLAEPAATRKTTQQAWGANTTPGGRPQRRYVHPAQGLHTTPTFDSRQKLTQCQGRRGTPAAHGAACYSLSQAHGWSRALMHGCRWVCYLCCLAERHNYTAVRHCQTWLAAGPWHTHSQGILPHPGPPHLGTWRVLHPPSAPPGRLQLTST